MVDPETLATILNNLRAYLGKLAILAALPQEAFTQDFTKVESAKHLLQVSIECCLDIAHHIVADEGYRTPTSYYDTFVVLENAILPEAFMLHCAKWSVFATAWSTSTGRSTIIQCIVSSKITWAILKTISPTSWILSRSKVVIEVRGS